MGDAGDDRVLGDGGNDLLDGGPGADTFFGDAVCTIWSCRVGNDEIQARDGFRDSVACGVGSGRAVVDTLEVVSSDFQQACESLDRPPENSQKQQQQEQQSSRRSVPFSHRVPAKVSLKRALRGGIAIPVSCHHRCSVRATARVDRATARRLRLGGGDVKVAGAATTLTRAGVGRSC
jgi:Ca2+-binding RTX toxin-like protein